MDFRVQQIPETLSEFDYVIVTLYTTDDEELRQRVLGPRNSGWKNAERSVQWNKEVMERPTVKNESKIDTTHEEPEETFRKVSELLA